ncbi:MAG TPA: ATP-binding protein [Syntrophorhabdales bacterium]|nr:ATP-binding protein [Syntrophorhabdales bacterium]
MAGEINEAVEHSVGAHAGFALSLAGLDRKVLYTTRSKFIGSFLLVALLVGLVSIYTGRQLLNRTVLSQTESRVSLDLNAAQKIYQGQVDTVLKTVTTAALDKEFQDLIKKDETEKLSMKLRALAERGGLDFLGVASPEGIVISRARPAVHAKPGKTPGYYNPLVEYVLKHGSSIGGTVVLEPSFLMAEDPDLVKQARTTLVPTSMAAPRPEKEELAGMAMGAGSGLYEGKKLIGVLYGGQLLNGNHSFVDGVRDALFQNDMYEGRSIGVTTIFLGDTRISSNACSPGGKRAIGTRASEKVRSTVLDRGGRWTDRAFVVTDWYLTAYEPIIDIFGKRVGMLATAVLEAKYRDVQQRALIPLVFVTVAGMLVAISMGFFLSNRITKPIRALIAASRKVSEGNFAPEIGPRSKDEMGVLQKTFVEMLASLQERDKRQSMESEIKLLQSEKQASIGRLAAGVAHEINNPLTGVLTFTHMLLRRKDIDEAMKEDLTIIAKATERVRTIVKGLLEFSRETILEREPADLNELVASAVKLVENSALVKGVKLSFRPTQSLPLRRVDKSAMQGVILNIIMNALDATSKGGSILVTTSVVDFGKTIEIGVSDTGHGIAPQDLEKIFEPFFTTKDVGQGTGLGLSVSLGIVERHGGSIHVESTLHKGSAFIVRLPSGDEDEH